MNVLPKAGHYSKGAEWRKATCIDCGEERKIILSPNKKAPDRCVACSRKRAARIWNGRRDEE